MINSLQLVSTKSEMNSNAKLRSGESSAFEQIIRTHNQRLFRIARAILRDSFEAEDIVQEAYIKAFSNLDILETSNEPGAWLAKITSNLAISRLRQKKRQIRLAEELIEDNAIPLRQGGNGEMSPEHQTALTQIRQLLEREIDDLSDGFREVFVLRMVEDMSVIETAQTLDLSPQTVKSRLHRARAKLQNSIKSQLTSEALEVFPFAGEHCDRITANVLEKLRDIGVTSAV
jgi:RNA polymerase sigma-70 factor (ECF subfamily)